MITVIRTPLGHKLSDNSVEGSASDSVGDVIITTSVNHGLSDGDYVYIESNIGSYNGIRYVDSTSYTQFKIRESENGEYIQFKQEVDLTYRVSVLNHGVQCVHLPIVYELESTLYPNNTEEEEYTPNTVATFQDNNGRVQLNLSAALSDPTRYAKIELVGDGDLSGVYQIVQVLESWSVIIDLAYSASYSFSGYTVVKYYDNYSVNVKVYGGLSATHRWEDEKPFELLATLRLVPDDDNKVIFSISEILRSQVKTINDLTIDTFPNNINFITQFYISYYESYDESDGDEITTTTTPETVDTFVGTAVNAKNEFKNENSGHLSEYVSTENYPAFWMTDFDEPIAIVGYFFDVSFFLIFDGVDVVITINKENESGLVEQETQTIENPGSGIIRVEITAESGFSRYCIQASTPGAAGPSSSMSIGALSTWTNIAGSGTDWTTGASPTITLSGGGPSYQSDYISVNFPFIAGVQYSITLGYSFNIPGSNKNIRLAALNSSNVIVASAADLTVSGVGSDTLALNFTAVGTEVKIAVRIGPGAVLVESDFSFTLNSISGTQTEPGIDAQDITEQLCITILEECDSTLINNVRELESSNLRLLE